MHHATRLSPPLLAALYMLYPHAGQLRISPLVDIC